MYHRKKLQEKLIGNKGYKLYHENIKFMQLIKQPKHQTAFSPSSWHGYCLQQCLHHQLQANLDEEDANLEPKPQKNGRKKKSKKWILGHFDDS